jgi:hypothetical protein
MKTMMTAVIGILAISTACFAGTTKAQWENLENLKKGQKIQIVRMSSIATDGEFTSVSDDEIVITVKKNPMVIKRSDIRRVSAVKSRTGHILAGLGIGAGAGFAVLASSSGDAVYGAMLALPLMAGGGAGIGATLPAKSVIYERP